MTYVFAVLFAPWVYGLLFVGGQYLNDLRVVLLIWPVSHHSLS